MNTVIKRSETARQSKKWITKLYYIVLLMTLNLASASFADYAHIDSIESDKFIEAYRKYFEKEVSANLFASQAQDAAAKANRLEILDFIKSHNLNAKDEDIEKEWNKFINKNYKSAKDFEKLLNDRYLNIDYVKNKFIQNQDLTMYFNRIVTPRINRDIQLRKKIFKISKNKKINFTELEFNKEFNQLIENWGGEEAFRDFMQNNNFSDTDIAFLVQTDILRKKLSSALVNQDIENNLELSRNLKNSISNHFHNFSLRNQANYFFKQVFVSKNDKDAIGKINKARKYFNDEKELEKIEGLEIYQMSQAISENSKLYHPKIKGAVLELNKDPLFVSKEISPIIETEHGYHLLQITSIEIPKELSYEVAYKGIYNKMVEDKYEDFSSLIDEYFKENLLLEN